MKSSMASLCHNLYWYQRLYGTDFLHLTFFAQKTTKTGKDVGFGISIVLNICETPVFWALANTTPRRYIRGKTVAPELLKNLNFPGNIFSCKQKIPSKFFSWERKIFQL
jgi:hypothetical protein